MRTHGALAIAACALIAALTAGGSEVFAHHSKSGYDSRKEMTVEGVVTEYSWKNPHVWVLWDAKADGGRIVRWTGELSAINTNLSLGMTKNSLKPGDEVVITINPSILGNPDGRVLKIVKKDGTVVMDMSVR
jgi:hypothetical protein